MEDQDIDPQQYVGQIIVFHRDGDECGQDEFIEPGMRARILSARHDRGFGLIDFEVDFAEFDHANRAYETVGFYDEDGNPTLTAREAGQYKERATIGVQDDLRFDMLGMEVIDDGHELAALPSKFADERNPGESYVAWLERSLAAQLQKNSQPGIRIGWSAPEDDPDAEPDMVFSWDEGTSKADANLMHYALTAPRAPASPMTQDWDPSPIDQLKQRGYDISTLTFSIQKKAPAPDTDPENDGAPKP